MAESTSLRVLSILVAILYPLIIYFGLKTVDPRWLILIVVLVATRYIFGKQFSQFMRVAWGSCVFVLVVATLITGSDKGLLIYPVLVNLLLLCLFFSSWLKPPTVIEMMARMRDPNLPVAAIAYTRNLTLVWCGFFIINGGISLASLAAGRQWWMLYNGLISYFLIGLLFGGELIFRRWILGR